MKRVVVTGVGIISSLGDNIPQFWENIKNGKHGISKLERFDTTDYGTKVAGEIKDFAPTKYGIDFREAKRMDLFTQYALACAKMAIEDAGTDFKDVDPFRVGVMVSTGIGGMDTVINEEHKKQARGVRRVSPYFIPMMIPNIAPGTIAIEYGFKGTNFSLSSACATSAHSIGEAYRHIKHGYEDVMITGGSESSILELAVAGFENMKALTAEVDPNKASVPFDKNRSGFVMSEGAGVLVLEELEHAKKRNAKIYGEIVGYGATDDAYHITCPDLEGTASAKAMEKAMEEAKVSPNEISYINAHGTSTPINDRVETLVIKKALGDAAYKTPISSSKSMTGHMLGAAGAVESIVSLLAIRDGILPPTAGYSIPDPECDLDYITEGARKADVRIALSNSLGFGGHNATLCFKRMED